MHTALSGGPVPRAWFAQGLFDLSTESADRRIAHRAVAKDRLRESGCEPDSALGADDTSCGVSSSLDQKKTRSPITRLLSDGVILAPDPAPGTERKVLANTVDIRPAIQPEHPGRSDQQATCLCCRITSFPRTPGLRFLSVGATAHSLV